MTKSKKQRTIEALRVIAHNYRNPIGVNPLGGTKDCLLCKIHIHYGEGYVMECNGCPFADDDDLNGSRNCSDLEMYKILSKLMDDCIEHSSSYVITKKSLSSSLRVHLNKAADALGYLIELLEPVPEKYFTKKGWKSFGLLDLEDGIINRRVTKLTLYE